MRNNQPCLVLIRGLLREQRHWGGFIPQMQQQFPDYDIITPDIPGNGCLNQLTSPTHIAQFTDALREQIGQQSTIHLVGLSMGGMIAVDWMQRFPAEIQSTVLINTSISNYSLFYQRLRWQAYLKIFKTLLASPESRERNILELTSNCYQNDANILNGWLAINRESPVSNQSAINQLMAAARFKVHVKPVHPLLIICSKADQLVNSNCSQAIHQQWGGEFYEHETAGHDLPLDDPEWLSQTIKSWIKML